MPDSKDSIEGRLHVIRGQRVLLDSDLARLYGVTTKAFNQTIKRHAARFPADFAFQLAAQEFAGLRSQPVRSNTEPVAAKGREANWSQIVTGPDSRHRNIIYRPWAFTEHGAIMAATLLRSPKAVAMSVYVVRAFVQMREALATSAVILRRLAEIDKRLVTHDVVLRDIYEKLRPLLAPPPEPLRREIGFHTRLKKP